MCKCNPMVKTMYCGKEGCERPEYVDININPIMYIFMNKSLGMSAGKLAAQSAHAANVSMANQDEKTQKLWLSGMHKTILIMEARDQTHLDNIHRYLQERGFKSHMIIDEGVNEIDPHVPTALASDVLYKDDLNVMKAFSTFKLYRDVVTVNLEINR